eukprot:gnl/TRDRNA2_/TRDRNA2_176097_c0_seq2.p1 gnl/TRDRNA2_/TRDRNA2_176097_c0~~gnl/TRDRNA2_/TRDRNA2_176097_c0_seq2.p1  ORF type:complete len:657 (+),score=111.03 gnl/TRDRNA2_/TRDRNA2_176097_c0_seq2:143-2113(+)
MHRAIPDLSPVCTARIRKLEDERRKNKIKNMRSSIDQTQPKTMGLHHFKVNLKAEQMMEDRCYEIDRVNRIMMNNIAEMMRKSGPNLRAQGGPTSVNADARRQELQRINLENAHLLNRIHKTKPVYHTVSFEQDYRDSFRRMKKGCNLPLVLPQPPPLRGVGKSSSESRLSSTWSGASASQQKWAGKSPSADSLRKWASTSGQTMSTTDTATRKKSNNTYASEPSTAATSPATPASDAFAALLGDTLKTKKGQVSTTTALAGKSAVGIYFSAHWCPPCRGFTPELAKVYKGALAAKGLEIVFVSSDRTESDFEGYYKDMPWLAVPFAARELKEKLSKKFKVQGIPTLVILDAEANTITLDGRSKVSMDPKGKQFPWKPRPFADVLGDSFCRGDAVVGKEAIAGKTLGIYFSAHWCPPCRGFTPTLAQHYKAYKERGLPFEIVFSTADKDEAAFDSYRAEMASAGGDWLSIPWKDSDKRSELDSLFGVSGIPCLVIVDENGQVVNSNARGAIAKDTVGDNFPWAPPAVGDLAQPEGIDEKPSICVFMDGLSPELQVAIGMEMTKVAEQYIAESKATGDDPKYCFFSAATAEGPVPMIRAMCSMPSDGASMPAMVLLDISDNGGFYRSDQTQITAASIKAFIEAYETKTIQRQQLTAP